MKGYDYKNLKILIGDDQADLRKLKKWKQVKDSSKFDVQKTSRVPVEVVAADGEVIHVDGLEV